MNNKYAPNHIIKYCCSDENDDFFLNLCNEYEDSNSFVYKLKCTCGCDKFIVYQDEHPSVFAKCNKCGEMITVYDLVYYPAAVKLEEEFDLNQVEDIPVYVYANYEYDDEFLYEESDEFDADDITWAKVFIADNELKMIMDDETA